MYSEIMNQVYIFPVKEIGYCLILLFLPSPINRYKKGDF